jgi:hypothetical protein
MKENPPSHDDLPGSATKKSSDLNGSPDAEPCRGGPPTLRNPEKLEPTFQIVTLFSPKEAVTKRRPSGENEMAETGWRWVSRT